MELSIRLKTVAEAVTKGNRVADVGTDHGYVPIYLVKNNLSPAGIAMDVNKGPLEKAQEHIREEKLGGKIATRLGNGLAPLEPGETDTVIIAGMGGDLICKILKAKPEFLIEGKEFILQPQSEWFKIRRLLKEYLEKEIVKKESIAADLKLSIKEMESEELSGKERGNIAKRQRRYQEIQKEIRDMRKAIG